MLFGFIIISFASYNNEQSLAFWFALLAIGILSCTAAFGESTILGYCKGFPSYYVGYFVSGTGVAGLFAAITLVTLKYFEFSLTSIYILLTPTAILNFICFNYLNRLHHEHPSMDEDESFTIINSNDV